MSEVATPGDRLQPRILAPPWPTALPPPDSLDLWRLDLASTPVLPEDRVLLSDEERARADACARPEVGARHIAVRAGLRRLLAAHLGCPPREVPLERRADGKPTLAVSSALAFNLAHSGAWALFVVASCDAVGVDLEEVKPRRNSDAVVRRFFSPAEQAAYAAALPGLRPALFHRAWVHKEAYLKARGTGLRRPLNSFTVAIGPDAAPALLADVHDPDAPAHWRLADVAAPTGYVASTAWCHALQDSPGRGRME